MIRYYPGAILPRETRSHDPDRGVPLGGRATRCETCGFENPHGMRFCGQCGAMLAAPPSSAEERKVITVLFADVVGSTRLLGTADPEQVQAQMARFFIIAQEEILRYGGTVDKYLGDAVMAVFGLPAVHEDDPERAARAAVAIRWRIRSDVEAGALPEIRIGINTGEVAIHTQANGTGERLVTSGAVNLAARFQQHAEPGQVLVGERTMLALRRVAAVRAIRPLTVKGADTPVPAWELVEVLPPREREVRATPFVGRVEELSLLAGHLRRMRHENRGHVITILGPAGVGKTRLVQEFRAQVGDVRILRGRALPYGAGVPFWALGEAIREECGILFGDPLEDARRKLEDAVARLEVPDALPALLAVLGLGGEGHELTREVLFSSMRTFFRALARRGPLLVILEDLHSAEDVTLDYVEFTADWIREMPLLLLVLSRPEMLERRPGWMGGKRSATTLFLDPLPGADSRELARRILGGKTVPDSLLDLVLERAEGNPLFMEEMLRTLLERGILVDENDQWVLTVPLHQVAIPDTVHAVIAARVDALPAPEKQVLQTAAIVGKDFWLGALRFVAGENHVDEALQTLTGKGLVVQKRRSTLRGEEELSFRHILIRDVAYAMLPKTQRWVKHARFAQWLHGIASDRQAEYADIIAHHWLQVVTLRRDLGLPADPDAHRQAVTNLQLAGDRAAGLYANATALDHYTRALELEPPPPIRFQALLGRGQVSMLLGQHARAREDFAEVRAQARDTGDRRWEVIALDHLGHSHRRQDQITRALEHLEPAMALSREVGDPCLTGRILNHIGFTYFSGARYEEAIRMHQEARPLLEGCGDLGGVAESLHGLGDNSVLMGRFQEGIRWLTESMRVSEQVGNRSLASENRFMIALSRQMLGDYAGVQAEAEQSVATLTEIGDAWTCAFALSAAARIVAFLGQFGKALEYATRGLGLARQIGAGRAAVFNLLGLSAVQQEMQDFQGAWQSDHEAVETARGGEVGMFWIPSILASLALDVAALGRPDEALTHLLEARRILAERTTRGEFLLQVAHAEGRISLLLGKPAAAREKALGLSEMAAAAGIRHWRIPALLLLADAAAALGNLQEAVPLYRSAADEAGRLGRTPARWRALAGLAEAQQALGQARASTASARRAREIIEGLAASAGNERLRATFLQSFCVQRALVLAGA